MTLYFAYGSNLNKHQMKRRCPAAKPLGKMQLRDWLLVFRGVADIIKSPGNFVNGGAWKITDACEEELDLYEGIAGGLYRKVYLPVDPIQLDGEWHDDMLVYVMNSDGIFPPSQGYLSTIRDGYRDFELPMGPLTAAVEASYENKAPSHIERQRHRRKGSPRVAPRDRAEAEGAGQGSTDQCPDQGGSQGREKEKAKGAGRSMGHRCSGGSAQGQGDEPLRLSCRPEEWRLALLRSRMGGCRRWPAPPF